MKFKKPDKIRSWIMSQVKGENTSPEVKIRSLLFKNGYRFRLHSKKLLGKPDIAFPARKAVIFVHGCFWHGHACKRGSRKPNTNRKYWMNKIVGNQIRDLKQMRALRKMGWRAAIVWECQLEKKKLKRTMLKLKDFLDNSYT